MREVVLIVGYTLLADWVLLHFLGKARLGEAAFCFAVLLVLETVLTLSREVRTV